MRWRALFLALAVGLPLTAAPQDKGKGKTTPQQDKEKAAKPAGEEKEGPNLPDGVTHVVLPPGALQLERVIKKGKPLLRLSVGKTSIEARNLFFGDGKYATEFEAIEGGVHWPSAKGGRGPLFEGMIHGPGSTIGVLGGDFLTVNQLKPGSVYITTPSIKFDFSLENNVTPKP